MAVCKLRQLSYSSRLPASSLFSNAVTSYKIRVLKTASLTDNFRPISTSSFAANNSKFLCQQFPSVTNNTSQAKCTKNPVVLRHFYGKFTDSTASNASVKSTGPNSAVQFASAEPATKPVPQDQNKPNMDQLQNIQNFMAEQIPVILSKRHEYRIYTKDLVFVNNWDVSKPYTTVGLSQYVLSVTKARLSIHLRYAMVSVSVLSSAVDAAAGCVRVRWTVTGLQQSKAFMFWRYRPFRFRATGKQQSDLMEGISTFYVNNKGFITRHVLDRVETNEANTKQTNSSTDKTALNIGST